MLNEYNLLQTGTPNCLRFNNYERSFNCKRSGNGSSSIYNFSQPCLLAASLSEDRATSFSHRK